MSAGEPGLGLGFDAGGTATRWALARADGRILAEGTVDGLHGRQVTSEERLHTESVLDQLARAARRHAAPAYVAAGITGFEPTGPGGNVFESTLARSLSLQPQDMALCNDVQMGYLSAFEPGEGYLVYAGTGSMAVFIDGHGVLHRAGGRGVLLDDGGGGFWIAKEALRRIWRREETVPQSWRESPMAVRLFGVVGAPEWRATRQFLYASSRGDIGKLALHVAASADEDPLARDVLRDAGEELARLANVHLLRHGLRPVVLAGGASKLHPLILNSMRTGLCIDAPLQMRTLQSHHKAAHLAAQGPLRLAELRRVSEARAPP
ncbi:BadF/BadG/BcrA/BcrD ATPase family protein [Variovorax humicola]|uniref:BadF/BadG/BcrA/BcrD ATPase family protein n=1 Tax=Variovorax humicola TaxID=1769758 RepID=A0ABU8W0L4_9BURK